jgi:hypothetical protein
MTLVKVIIAVILCGEERGAPVRAGAPIKFRHVQWYGFVRLASARRETLFPVTDSLLQRN